MANKKKMKNRKHRPVSPKRDAGRPVLDAESRSAHAARSDKQEIIVRMYRQGLGDCFLLTLPAEQPGDPHHMLIDCGVHMRQGKGTARLKQVMDDIAAETGSHLDVVVATHEHADHLSGFVQKKSPFLKAEFKIDQLWVAWTEKRGDEQADTLRKKHGTARRLIEKAVEEATRLSGNRDFAGGKRADDIQGLTDFERPEDQSVDETAVLALLNKMKKQPLSAAKKRRNEKPSANELALGLLEFKAGENNATYCEPADVLKVPGVSGFRAYVLGPPRDPTLLKQDDPTKISGAKEGDAGGIYKEVYLSGRADSRALELSPRLNLASYTVEGCQLPDAWRYPFHPSYQHSFKLGALQGENPKLRWSTGSREEPVSLGTENFINAFYLKPASSWRRIDSDWLGAAEGVALDLDSDTNNTGLVLAFEWGPPSKGAVLLFPGDAQVGNWLSWHKQDYRAGEKMITADSLLSRTVLYKVGHHGSHNATIRRDPNRASGSDPLGAPFGLELMNNIVAMIPVDWDAAKKKMPDPWRMPHEPLYRRLREKAHRRVLRSDMQLHPLNAGTEEPDIYPTSKTWQPVPGLKNFRWRRSEEEFLAGTPGPLYYELAIGMAEPDE